MNKVIASLKKTYKDKNVLIVGLGLLGGGVGLAKFFAKLGANVTVTDKKDQKILQPSIDQLHGLPITFHLGKDHDLDDFINTDVIFKGPFVPWDLVGIKEAEKRGIPIEMELSFFAHYCPAKIIGVTGTRGKSTTTYMIYQMLKDCGYHVHLGGSLPDISTISLLPVIDESDWVVLELPSWPLAGFHQRRISPHIAVFTNFYPDHLNFYKTMDDYLMDKKAIYLYQSEKDFFIAGKQLDSIIRKDQIKSSISYIQATDFPYEFKYLKGEHNKENAASALAVATIIKANTHKAIQSLISFKGLPFRQETVGKTGNVIFINDTTSTTPISTIKAIDTFFPEKIVLILGGNSKHLPHGELLDKLSHVDRIVLLKGSFTDEIFSYLKTKYGQKISEVYDNLEMAVDKAFEFAKINNPQRTYVLFSPGATSFAMFNNEFHRGEKFNKIVKEIINNQ